MIWRTFTLTRIFDSRRAPFALQVLTAGVVILIAVSAAGVIWRISGLDDGRERVALAPTQAGPTKPFDISPIVAWAPFGGAVATAQASTSGLVLKAIFLAVPAEASSALIADGETPAVAVRPGEALPGGAVVQSIAVDYVLLSVGGQTERLDFPQPVVAEGQTAAPTPAAPATITVTPATPPAASAPSPAAAAGIAPSVVEQYRQRLAGNAPAVAREMGVTATPQGYRVGNDLPAEMRAAGLQAGDVVSRVNNQPVGVDANPRAILDQAITSGGARVEVIRNGRTLTLSFPLR